MGGGYNSALHKICTSLQLCGKVITNEEKIEKALSTFHPNAVQSARNYRQDGYKEYAELITSCKLQKLKMMFQGRTTSHSHLVAMLAMKPMLAATR